MLTAYAKLLMGFHIGYAQTSSIHSQQYANKMKSERKKKQKMDFVNAMFSVLNYSVL